MNILLLWTDEQRADTLECYGNKVIQMPNLNRLARESTVFKNAYCASPVCTPSRGTVMTGLYPHHHGAVMNNIPLNADAGTLPELCGEGYVTHYIGKWHLGDEIFAQHGWQGWQGVEESYRRFYLQGRDRRERSSYHHWLVEKGYEPDYSGPDGSWFSRGFAAKLPEVHSKPQFEADEAIRFIREQGKKSWILSVNTLEPHMPFTGPRNSMYSPDSLPVSDNFMVPPDESCNARKRIIQQGQELIGAAGFNPMQEGDIRRCIANYWGLCSQVDYHYGRILECLKTCGIYDDTLIVFTSDHGDMMGSHGMIAKCVMYEEAVRIPLLIKLPGQRSCRCIDNPVSQVDLIPTLLDAAGESMPEELDGKSLLSSCTDGVEPTRDVHMVWHVDDGHDNANNVVPGIPMGDSISEDEMERCLRSESRAMVTPDRFKLIRTQRGECELYNLNSDPCELRNLAADEEYKAKLAELNCRLRQWQHCVGDNIDLVW